jgi:hypothetical protein
VEVFDISSAAGLLHRNFFVTYKRTTLKNSVLAHRIFSNFTPIFNSTMNLNFGRTLPDYFFIIVFLPVVLFAFYVYNHSINVPFMDDMELVETINNFKNNVPDIFTVLVRQQNDHRITFARLGIIAAYLLDGQTNFKLAILLGYLNLILLGFAFFLVYKSRNDRIAGFLPITVILFSPIVYFVHLSSITSFQHPLSLAFSIIALYFLQPSKKRYWYFAMIFSMAASLTHLDGISTTAVALLWLATQKRWNETIYFSIFGAVYYSIYFTNFSFSPATNLSWTWENLLLMTGSFFTATGSLAKIVSDTYGVALSFILGTIMVSTYLITKVFTKSGYARAVFSPGELFRLDFTDICFLRLLASTAMIAIGRFSDGIGTMTATRFQVYSVSVVILFYLYILKRFRYQNLDWFKMISFFTALVISAYSYKKYHSAVKYFEEGLMADSYNYPHTGLFLHQYINMPDPNPGFYQNYTFPVHFEEKWVDFCKNSIKSAKRSAVRFTSTDYKPHEKDPDYIFPIKELKIENGPVNIPDKRVYLGLLHDNIPNKFYLIALLPNNGSWVSGMLKNDGTGNYRCEIPEKLPAGAYTAVMCWTENGRPNTAVMTDKVRF